LSCFPSASISLNCSTDVENLVLAAYSGGKCCGKKIRREGASLWFVF
jgi:hypothetical protein